MYSRSIRFFLLLWLGVLGLLSLGWAKTDTVPAPTGNATTDTANITKTITGAASGDTVQFQAGTYQVNADIQLTGSNLTYNGAGCTLLWVGTANNYIFAFYNGSAAITNATVTGFTFCGYNSSTDYGGTSTTTGAAGIYIQAGSSYITITGNTFYNLGLSTSDDCGIATGQGALSSNITISNNTFYNIGETDAAGDELDEYATAISAYDLNNSTISNNIFHDIRGDCVHGLALYADSTIAYLNNTGVTNIARNGLELQNQGGSQSALTIENNTFNCTGVGDSSCVMGLSGLTVENSTIKNNTLSAYWGGYGIGMEFCTGGADVNLDNLITNNYISADTGFYFSNRVNNQCSYNLLDNCSNPINDDYYSNSASSTVPANTFQNDIIISTAAQTVTVTATNGATSPYTPGSFTFSRGSATSGNLLVNYTLGGTAINGLDYIALSGSALIPNGASSTVVAIDPLDGGKSGNDTVTATLAFGGYFIGTTSAVTSTLDYNGKVSAVPTYVTIAPTTSSVTEGGSTGTYTITRSGVLANALTVAYTMGGTATAGTDYTVSPSNSVTIAANSASATITLTPTTNSVVDGVTSAVATLASGSGYTIGYPNSAAMSIVNTNIPSTNLQLFLRANAGVTTSGNNVVSWADYSGQNNTATVRTGCSAPTYVTGDINELPAVRFAGGWQCLQFPVEPGFTALGNGASVFIVTYPNGGAYWTNMLELGNQGDYDALTFGPSYANSGGDNTDFQLGSSEYAQDNAIVGVATTGGAMPQTTWQLLEGTIDTAGNVLLYHQGTQVASGNTGYPLRNIIRTNSYLGGGFNTSNSSYSGDIAEVLVYGAALSTANRQTVENYLLTKYGLSSAKPMATVSGASPSSVNEAGGSSTYTITRSGSTTSSLTVDYTMQGTAVNGTDYTTLPGSVTIASGATTATVTLTAIDRHILTGSVTAQIALATNANYTVSSPYTATVTIQDDDGGVTGMIDDTNAAISYSGFTAGTGVSDYDGTEHYSNTANAYAQVTFNSTQAVLIGKKGANFGIGSVYIDGTKVGTFDGYNASLLYQQTLYTVSGLASGSHTMKIMVTGTRDASSTDNYVVVDAFNFTPPSFPTVTVTAAPTSINEASGSSTYTVTRTGGTTTALTVNYAMSGTAVSGTDYTTVPGSLSIASGATTGTITLTALDRVLTSGSCTAILTLAPAVAYTVGASNTATVTINDNDAAPTAVAVSTSNASSPLSLASLPANGITIQATPTGGGTVVYQYGYCLYNTSTGAFAPFVSLSNGYVTASSYQWTPTQSGTYALAVMASEQGSGVAQATGYLGFTILPASTLTAVTVSTPGIPSPLNITAVPANGITIAAAPTGGTNVEYLYGTCLYDAPSNTWGAFTPIGTAGYTASTSCQWTPTQGGAYSLQALAREHGSNVAYQVYGTQGIIIAAAGLTGVTLQTDAAHPSPQPENTAITLTATTTGMATPQYDFVRSSYNTTTNTWGPYQPIAGGYQSGNTCVWTPAQAGTYAVAVEARVQGSAVLFDVYDIKGYVITP